MANALDLEVWRRADEACEYCRMPQVFSRTPFQVDHIIAEQHAGETRSENLALSCLHCNKHKGPNIAGIDPLTRKRVWLFNPRRQKWNRHFQWNGPRPLGRTAVGRAIIAVLAINHRDAVAARQALIDEEVFPP